MNLRLVDKRHGTMIPPRSGEWRGLVPTIPSNSQVEHLPHATSEEDTTATVRPNPITKEEAAA